MENLDAQPSSSNITKLTEYVKKIPAPLKNLHIYEQHLYASKKNNRVLFISCNDRAYKNTMLYPFIFAEEKLQQENDLI